MAGVNDILEAVCTAVKEALPGEPCYTNLQPRDGRRPCTLVTLEKLTSSDLNAGTVQMEAVVNLTALVEADPYRHSQFETLADRQAVLTGLFLPGFLRVGDRALHVTALGGTYQLDFAQVQATLTWAEDRPAETAALPLMQNLMFHTKGENYGTSEH